MMSSSIDRSAYTWSCPTYQNVVVHGWYMFMKQEVVLGVGVMLSEKTHALECRAETAATKNKNIYLAGFKNVCFRAVRSLTLCKGEANLQHNPCSFGKTRFCCDSAIYKRYFKHPTQAHLQFLFANFYATLSKFPLYYIAMK